MLMAPAAHTAVEALIEKTGKAVLQKVRGSVGGRMKSLSAQAVAGVDGLIAADPEGAAALDLEEALQLLPPKTQAKIEGIGKFLSLVERLKSAQGGTAPGAGGHLSQTQGSGGGPVV